MAIPPRQIHPSWYRRFWYAERSPLRALLDRVLIFGIVALVLLAGATRLAQRERRRAQAWNRPASPQGCAELAAARGQFT